MAPFNPGIQPTQEQDYTRNSRAIDPQNNIQPTGQAPNSILPKGVEVGDRSAEYAGNAKAAGYMAEATSNKGFGDLFAGIVQTGDFLLKASDAMIKKNIENEVYNVANKEREEYTQALELRKSIATDPKTGKSLLDANASMDEPVPGEIEDGIETVVGLQNAKGAGKISNTQYISKLVALSKDLRARHPGYREYIDKEFSQVTGFNPANAYITSLVRDINQGMAAKGNPEQLQAQKYVLSRPGYVSNGVDAQGALAKVQAGEWGLQDALRWSLPQEKLENEIKTRNLDRGDRKGSKEEIAERAANDAAFIINARVTSNMDSILVKIGATDEASVSKLMERVRTGQYKPEQIRQFGETVKVERDKMFEKDIRMGYERIDGKPSIVEQLGQGGGEKYRKIVEERYAPMDTFVASTYDQNFGKAFSAQNQSKALLDQEKYALLSRPDEVGDYFKQVAVQSELGGPNYEKEFFLNALKDDVKGKWKEWMVSRRLEMNTQTKAGETGKTPYVLNDVFKEMRDHVKSGKMTTEDAAKFGNKIINDITEIYDPNTPDSIKANLAKSAFSPENLKFIAQLSPDGVSSKDGRPIKGRMSAFERLTSQEMTNSIMALKGPESADIKRNYINWASQTFGQDLYMSELSNLGKMADNPNVKIAWSTENQRFVVAPRLSTDQNAGGTYFQGRDRSPVAQRETDEIERSVNRINDGLRNLKGVAKVADGMDVESFLLRTMFQGAGANPNGITGIPAKFLNAIKNSQQDETDKIVTKFRK